jgi:formate hydrogenlyase transcriptional activator
MASASEADETLRSIIDAIPGHVFILDRDARYVVSNQQALDYLGLTHEELSGQDVPLQVVHPDDIDRFIALRNQSFSAGTLFETEVRVRGKDGHYRWFLVRIKPLRDAGGQIIRWYGIRTEIDARKRAEEHVRMVIDSTPALIDSGRADGYLEYVNQRWLEYLQVPLGAIEGWSWTNFVHPDDVDALVRDWRTSLAKGAPFEAEARVRRGDGQYRWMQHRKLPLHDEEGNIVRWFGSSVDIEQQKRAEKTIRENEQELRTTIETIPTYVWTNLPDGTLDFVSQSWLDYIGLTRDEYLGWRWTENVHPDDVDAVVANYRQALATGRWPKDQEVRGRNGKGEYRWFLVRGRPLRGENGEIVRWYGTIVDIEDRKRAEEALRQREVLLVRTTDELQKLKDQLEKENLALKDEINEASMFEEIVGSSGALRRVLSMVSRVAPTESTVLITGETGTGKELVARAIHKRSDRAARAFVAVSCAAIAPSLVTSELFGYEKGAFTGALQRHLGRFELAEGGTIFLDEVGELPPETQIALLRVLQERTFERVGGGQSIPANVRVVAATNRDLQEAVETGTFRQDLYYRLNVFPLHLPPLRDRVEDVPVLVQYFANRYAARIGKKISKVDKKTLALLQEYRWPGNVRELQNVIERAVILCDGDTLVVDETWLQQPAPKEGELARGIGRLSASEEKAMIESALAGARGRVAGPKGAAARLGIARTTLESRIRALRINKNSFKSQ